MASEIYVTGDGEQVVLGVFDESAKLWYDRSGNTLIQEVPSAATISWDIGDTAAFTVATGAIAASAANSGAVSTFTVTNTSNDSSAGAEISVVAGGASASGDAKFSALETSGHEIVIGIDTSASLGVIAMDAVLGSSDGDAIRITPATPPVVTYNATHPTGTFDYVCDTCNWHGAALSNHPATCQTTPKWHDDVLSLAPVLAGMNGMRLRGDEPGIQHLVDLGVMEVTPDDQGKNWVGIRLDSAQWFTWSAMQQMYNRITELEAKVA
jgi:hypothetical protein